MFWSRSRFWARRWLGGGAMLAVMPLAGGGCHGRHHERAMTEEEAREHAQDVTEFVLARVDASAEQEARMDQVLERLVPDLLALRPERQALVAELQAALGAEQVDPARIEAIRLKGLELASRASERASRALAEAAQVLSASQRAELVEHWRRRHRS